MDGLNKQQLILLALLVSFVTSIATGIITVSLMDQAPAGITQTINRVVEKTIERVVTEPSQQAAVVATKETVVVKADDQVIDAIAKNAKSFVRIREVTNTATGKRESFAGIGLIVSAEGLIVADIDVAYRKTDEGGNSIPEGYIGVFPSGSIFPLNIVRNDPSAGLIFFEPIVQEREKGTHAFTPPVFSTGELKLGQTVVAIGGSDSNTVSTGIISNLVERSALKPENVGTSTQKVAENVLLAIKTDLRATDLVSGALLIDLSGEVIGFSAGSVSTSRSTFVPVARVLEAVTKLSKSAQ